MEISKLQTAVFEKTGVRVGHNDPIFTLVALNEVVIEELLASSQEQWAQNNSELDAKIGALSKLHEQILAASKDLAARVDQAHMAAALKAASEAKADIFKAARDAVSVEVENSAMIITDSVAKLEAARKNARADSWTIAIVQAAIGGMVAGVIVLAGMAIMTS